MLLFFHAANAKALKSSYLIQHQQGNMSTSIFSHPRLLTLLFNASLAFINFVNMYHLYFIWPHVAPHSFSWLFCCSRLETQIKWRISNFFHPSFLQINLLSCDLIYNFQSFCPQTQFKKRMTVFWTIPLLFLYSCYQASYVPMNIKCHQTMFWGKLPLKLQSFIHWNFNKTYRYRLWKLWPKHSKINIWWKHHINAIEQLKLLSKNDRMCNVFLWAICSMKSHAPIS